MNNPNLQDWCAPIITSSVKHRLSAVDPFASTEAFNNAPQPAPWLALERRLGDVLASKELNQAVDHLIDAIAPNRREHRRRQRVVEEVQHVLHSNLGNHIVRFRTTTVIEEKLFSHDDTSNNRT